jgi:hypothetical protein
VYNSFDSLRLSIRSQVSDQCKTEGKFVKILESYKESVLKGIFEDCDGWDEGKTKRLAKLVWMGFFAHIVSGISEGVEKAFKTLNIEKAGQNKQTCFNLQYSVYNLLHKNSKKVNAQQKSFAAYLGTRKETNLVNRMYPVVGTRHAGMARDHGNMVLMPQEIMDFLKFSSVTRAGEVKLILRLCAFASWPEMIE